MLLGQLVGSAMAQTAAAPQTPSIIDVMILPLGLMFILYFLILRPQQRKARLHQDTLSNLKAGDEVVTTGGIIGRIRSITDSIVTLEVAANVAVRVLKANIVSLTNPPSAPSTKRAKAEEAKKTEPA